MSLSAYLRTLANKGTFDAEDIPKRYETWVNEDKYMVMCHQKEPWIDREEPTEYIGVKCAKRGNDVYLDRVQNRLLGLGGFVDDLTFDFERHPYAKVLFATLTYDTKICSFDVAWKNIGVEFNRFKANIRKKYGAFSVFRTWESFRNGHPHIHAIFVFREYEFKVFKSFEEGKGGELREVWLINEKNELEKYWHSWIKIKAVYNLAGGLNYLTKYIMKCAEYVSEDRKGVLTLAMCWVFRKKAFYVPGEFREALSDLIRSICSSKTRKVQIDLTGRELKANEWKVLGFIDAIFLDTIGVDFGEQWFIRLTANQMNDVFDKWDKTRFC
jgi:hypothetical protein